MTVWKSKTMETIKGSEIVRGVGDRGELNRQRTVGNWLYIYIMLLLFFHCSLAKDERK